MPFWPADTQISFAERQVAIRARSKFFTLTIINTSESTRRPKWILLSPGSIWANINKLSAFSLDGVVGAAWQSYAKYIRDMLPLGHFIPGLLSITWAYEVCIVSPGSEIALLDMEPLLLHTTVVDRADLVQHS
eukprot:9501292-Pyramimonas_sp.AAC.1